MRIELPETTDLEVVLGEKTYSFDLLAVNDKLYELQQEASNGDSWEEEWINSFRAYLRSKHDVLLSFGQASYLANQIMIKTDEVIKKLNQ